VARDARAEIRRAVLADEQRHGRALVDGRGKRPRSPPARQAALGGARAKSPGSLFIHTVASVESFADLR
jgi:hypothetical protein